MIRSFAKVWPHVGLADIGIEEQVEQWKLLGDFPGPKIIVDSDEMLANPDLAFAQICTALELPYIRCDVELGERGKALFGPPIGTKTFRPARDLVHPAHLERS